MRQRRALGGTRYLQLGWDKSTNQTTTRSRTDHKRTHKPYHNTPQTATTNTNTKQHKTHHNKTQYRPQNLPHILPQNPPPTKRFTTKYTNNYPQKIRLSTKTMFRYRNTTHIYKTPSTNNWNVDPVLRLFGDFEKHNTSYVWGRRVGVGTLPFNLFANCPQQFAHSEHALPRSSLLRGTYGNHQPKGKNINEYKLFYKYSTCSGKCFDKKKC